VGELQDSRLEPHTLKDWDVSFRLHARYLTVIGCEVRGGKVHTLRVTPERRRRDVVTS
jgi:hypothetical protein